MTVEAERWECGNYLYYLFYFLHMLKIFNYKKLFNAFYDFSL